MSYLRIFEHTQPETSLWQSDDHSAIAQKLSAVGIRFEQWQVQAEIAFDAAHADILQAYALAIERLVEEEGYVTVDVVSLSPEHPDKAMLRELRNKFLSEHTHSEDEVRFFVRGQGLFSLHIEQQVFEVLCQQGDLISVPANTPHWFDMGAEPDFVAIRLFNNPEGWVANYTQNAIADRFSRMEAYCD